MPGVDLLGDRPNDVGAAAWPVAAGPIGMGGLEPAQDPGPVQKIVHQGIDRDHAARRLRPSGRTSAAPIRMPDNAIVSTLSETP